MEIKIINFNGVREYIDVMYYDTKAIEKGYQVQLAYDGYDIKRVIEYFYKVEQERDKYKSIVDELKEEIKLAIGDLQYNELVNGKVLLNNVLNVLKELEEGNSNE